MDDKEILINQFRQLLLDSKSVVLVFMPGTTKDQKIGVILNLDQMYKAMGGGAMKIDKISDSELTFILKPSDDPENNLVY